MDAITLGPAGTYSHRATRSIADEIEFTESVTEIVSRVESGATDRGVIPIENSIEGSVTESLDALATHEVAIVGEIVTPIRHALIAQGPSFETIESHPQALAQCRAHLAAEYPSAELVPVSSTAQGVERARSDPTAAAIAHPDNADAELTVLAEGIQDRSSNATRFMVLAPEIERTDAGGKTSLIVAPDTDHPGLLLELLEPFAERDINLSRIESRPTGDRLGEYLFHIDIDTGLYEQRTQNAIAEIETEVGAGSIQRLGSYDTEHVVE